jgi:hypothetical protein
MNETNTGNKKLIGITCNKPNKLVIAKLKVAAM